ncbi:hypothetical protein RB195_024889 [Necator americanus]|uniref:Secreted protein n=1 Tax=Necator americanus TaxID=51031 RepID=A0ABR1ES52_NECAM
MLLFFCFEQQGLRAERLFDQLHMLLLFALTGPLPPSSHNTILSRNNLIAGDVEKCSPPGMLQFLARSCIWLMLAEFGLDVAVFLYGEPRE